MEAKQDTLTQAAKRLRRSIIREGKPFPLGATWDGLGVNFAIFSAMPPRSSFAYSMSGGA